MCRLEEQKCASTSTCGGKLTELWDEDDESDEEMYVYLELTQAVFNRKKCIEGDGSGDKKLKLPMRKSLFAHVPPYIIFHLYNLKNTSPLPVDITRHLSWRYSSRIVPQMVGKTVAKSGFKFAKKNGDDWSGNWGPPMALDKIKTLKVFQKVNHIPGTLQLTRKDLLWKNLSEMIERFGKLEFGFTPTTYVFPEDERRFQKFFERHGGVWIVKPTTGCGGNGIRVVSKRCEIPKRYPLVVQRYITNPRLVRGVKFDMRLYALITSVDPLRIYIYGEGLVRFATSKYLNDVNYLFDRYMHLTNTSVNKTSPMFKPNDSIDKCKGNMWSLSSIWFYLATKQQVDVPRIWEKIKDIVVKTVVSAEAKIVEISRCSLPSKSNAYQLLGFDIMLDEDLTPWLLEVNNHPSMDPDTPLCAIVKGQLAKDFLNIAGFQIPNTMSQREAKCLTERYGEHPLCQDGRLEVKTLTEAEEMKQNKFSGVKNREDYLNEILKDLTPDDVRHLVLYEDEIVGIGSFEKIFPTKNTPKYHKFFKKLSYYNKLFDAWEEIYGFDKSEGVSRLQKLCKKKYHLLKETILKTHDSE